MRHGKGRILEIFRLRRHSLRSFAYAQDDKAYFGAMRIAPSMRIVSPLSMLFSMMCCTSAANSGGLPNLLGKGTCSLRDAWAASGKEPSRGVGKVTWPRVQRR